MELKIYNPTMDNALKHIDWNFEELKKEVTDSVSRVNPNKTRIYFESSDSNMANMETFLNPFKLEDIDDWGSYICI